MHRPDNTGGLRKMLKTLSDGKVDKITGKGLSKNDYSDAEKAALASASTSISQLSEQAGSETLETTAQTLSGAVNELKSDIPVAIDGKIPNVYIDGDYLDDFIDKEDERYARLSFRSATLNFDTYIKIKPQGTSSLVFPKKNWTVKMYTDNTYDDKEYVSIRSAWGEQYDYVLKADWVDPTHACNVVSAQLAAAMQAKYGLFAAAPNSGLIDGFPVLVHFNGVSIGLYNWTIRKGGWQFGFTDDDEDTAMVLSNEVQDASGAFLTSANFETDWDSEYGKDNAAALAAFNRMVEWVRDVSDADFRAHISEYLNLDSAMNYYLFCWLSAALDNLGKNMLMVTSDRQIWYPSLYDLDSLWGVDFDGDGQLAYNFECPYHYQCSNSRLWSKLVANFPDELADRYRELRETVLSNSNIINAFAKYIYAIPQRLYDEDATLWPDITALTRTLNLMRAYIPQRAQYVDYQVELLRTIASGDYGRVLYDLPETFVGDGVSAYVDTGIRLFDNPDKDWTLFIKIPTVQIAEGWKVYAACYWGVEDVDTGVIIRQNADGAVHIGVGAGAYIVASGFSGDNVVLAIVKNRDHYRIFQDGELIVDFNETVIETGSLVPLRIGSSGNANEAWQYSICTVNNLRVYQRALGDADVAAVTTML